MRVTTLFSTRGLAAFACATVLAASAAQAQEPQQPQAQKEHVVRPGDTLWDLARTYLNDPFRWPLIFQANREIVENPHRIFPAERLVIPGIAADATEVVLETPQQPRAALTRSRFYTAPLVETDPTLITSELIRNTIIQPMEYLAAPWLADSALAGINGNIIRPVDPRNVDDKLAQNFHPRDELYVSVIAPHGRPGDLLLVVRMERVLKPFGWVVEPMGILRIDSITPTTTRATIVDQFGELQVGHMTIPMPIIPALPVSEPVEVLGGAEGHIIDFLAPQPLYGTTDIAFIDIGAANGLRIGDDVLAYVPPRRPDDKEEHVLPEVGVALLRVVKVMDNTATVRVTRVHEAALRDDLQVRVAKQTQ